MIYQIYFGDTRGKDHTLFDIEVYLNSVTNGDNKGKWYSEIHVSTFAAGIANFIWSNVIPIGEVTKMEFLEDCNEIDSLRGWLYERTPECNKCLPSKEANERHYNEVIKHVTEVVYRFAKRYNCYVNQD